MIARMLTAAAWCCVCAVLLLRVRVHAVNVCVVKQRPMVLPPKPEPVVWVVGTDNSPHAKHALDTTLALMGNGDVLYVFCATAIPSQPASVSWADKTINRQPASQPASTSQPAPASHWKLRLCFRLRVCSCGLSLLSSGVVLVFRN
jgi:hypothetical protein